MTDSSNRAARFAKPASILLATVVFAIDLQVELGVSTYVLYVPVLVLAARVPGHRFVAALSLAATVLTVLGYHWSPAGGEPWKTLLSAALGIVAIWITAAFLIQQKRITSDRDRAVERADRTERESVTKQHEHRVGSLLLEAAEEGERGRIAREVHDALGQPLAALKFDIEWLGGKLSASDAGIRGRIEEMEGLVDTTIGTVRRLAAELRPSTLDDVGLLAAIRSQVTEFSKRTSIRCELAAPNEEPGWPIDRSTTVYRIFQEALTNVLRHAGASSVRIRLEQRGDEAVLVVRDDGCGIRPDQAAAPDAMGLRGMRERARLHQGTVRVDRSPQGGTTVTARIPLADPGGTDASYPDRR